jgi:predicted nucleic acid-binding protein
MKYLLDTDTLIDFLQDHGETRSRLLTTLSGGDEVALSPITVAELYSGLPASKRAKWREFICALPYWDISRQAAQRAGIARKAASDAGRTLSVSDSLVAAVAREQQAIVLTSNIKDFLLLDVQVLSLREPAASPR